jgi:hypothetical protein
MESFAMRTAQILLLPFVRHMHPIPTPWTILSATHGVGILTPGWTLDAPVHDPEIARSFSVSIPFATSFTAPPVVHLGLTGFDLDQNTSGRISLIATDITPQGFTAVIRSWSNTQVYAVEFQWLAIGA